MTGETRNRLRPVHVPPLRIRWLRRLLLLVMLGMAVHLLLPQIANLAQAWQTIQQMPWWAVGLAVLAQLASYGGSGYLLAALADILNERLSVAQGVIITLAGSSIGLVAGGIVGSSAATYRWTRASGLSGQAAGLCGTLPPVFNNLLLVSLAIIGLLHLLLIHQLTVLQAISFGLVLFMLALLAGVVTWGIMRPDWLARPATRIAGKWAQIRKRPYDPATVENSVNQLANTWNILRSGGWRGPTLGALINIGGDILTLYFLFVAAGQAVSPGVLLTGYGLPLIIAKLGFPPGGVGIVEATMTAIYASLGVPDHITVVVILGYRLISFWIPTLFGFPLALYLQRATTPEKPSA